MLYPLYYICVETFSGCSYCLGDAKLCVFIYMLWKSLTTAFIMREATKSHDPFQNIHVCFCCFFTLGLLETVQHNNIFKNSNI